jgi:hypothetical protein
MATIDQYKIVVDVQGEQAVERLKNSIGGLGTALTGIAFGAFTAGIFNMADAVSDLADATGLAAGEVQAFQNAMVLAGGDAENAGKAIVKFYKTLEEGASDQSSKAAEALAKVGIGLNELRTLSEGQLLAKTLQELAGMDAGAARTALGIELLGKSFGMINPKTFQEILKTQDVEALQDELNRLGQVNDNIQASFMELQKAGIDAFGAILGPIENFRLSADQASTLIKILGAGIAIAFSASVVRNVITLVSAVSALSKALRITAIAQAAVVALTGPAGWAVLAAGAAAAAAAVYGLDKLLGDANKETVALGNSAKTAFGQMNAGKGGAFKGATGVTKQQADNRAKEALAAKQVTDQMIRQNDEANKLRQQSIDLMGMESTRANLIQSNARAESDGRKQIADLDAKIVAERAKGKDTNAAIIVQLQQQKDEVTNQVNETTRLNDAEAKRTLELKRQQDILDYNIQLIAISGNIEAQKFANQVREKVIAGRLDEEQANRTIALINEREQHAARLDQMQQKLNAASKAGDDEQATAIAKLMDLETKRYNSEIQLLIRKGELQDKLAQSSEAGAVAAMNNIAKQFEPYKMAQDAILMGWNKIGSAVDEFVETGKFKFSDFARSVVQDLLKMIIKAQIFKAIQGTLGLFGISIPGLASGGPAKAGQPYIVGEKGPELFVPKSAGTVIPNNKLPSAAQATGSGMVNAPITNNYITNNIQAVDAKSVAQLFAENRKTLLGSVEMARRELPYQMA